MIGISNKLSAEIEINQSKAAIENFAARIIETGKIPGTHSLGIQFDTWKKNHKHEFQLGWCICGVTKKEK